MSLKLRDLPRFPDYTPGFTDHDYMRHARSVGPLAVDKFGIVCGFSLSHMERINDDRWTRQVEMETMLAAGVTKGPMFDFVRNVMLFSNGQTHRNRRGPLVRTFAHRVIADLRPDIARRTDRCIATLAGSGQVDFLSEIAGPLPAEIIAAIVGAPDEDTNTFAAHVYSAIRGLSFCSDEVRAQSNADIDHLGVYIGRLIADRRTAPLDDLLTGYLDRVADGPLSEDEIRAQMVGLVVAGSDTTRGALTATVSQLLQHPDQWALLVADPDRWAPAAVSEGLRFDPVIGSMARITTEARELDGVLMPEGTFVMASMLTALRDPEVYADPDRFAITRTDHPRLHPVFGGGPHRCLGEALARIELEESLKSLARMVPDLTLAGPPAQLRGYGAVREVSPMLVNM